MPSDFLLESFLALVSKEIDDDLRSGTGAAAAPLPTDAGGCAAGGGIALASDARRAAMALRSGVGSLFCCSGSGSAGGGSGAGAGGSAGAASVVAGALAAMALRSGVGSLAGLAGEAFGLAGEAFGLAGEAFGLAGDLAGAASIGAGGASTSAGGGGAATTAGAVAARSMPPAGLSFFCSSSASSPPPPMGLAGDRAARGDLAAAALEVDEGALRRRTGHERVSSRSGYSRVLVWSSSR